MKFSIFMPTGFGHEFAGFDHPVEAFERITAVAQTADRLGFETLWAPDHLTAIPPTPTIVFEAWSMLTALARDTSRVRIGQLVSCNSYRNPALAAKMASTLDVISRGRLTFGIGAGWHEPDYTGFGYHFGTVGERLRHLDEAAQIILALWREDAVSFEGEFYTLNGAVNEPSGEQLPHIPLMIAGGGEKVTLRLVARHANASNILESPDGLRSKYEILRRHCEAESTSYDAIWRTSAAPVVIGDTDAAALARLSPGLEFAYPGDVGAYGLIGSPDTIRERIAAYEAAGVQELALGFEDPTSVEHVERFAELFMN